MALTPAGAHANFSSPMKCLPAISALAVIGLSACDTMNDPISGGGFDPLGTPGGRVGPSVVQGQAFKAGEFVRAGLENTAFYRTRPKGDANADKLLTRGTSMKVIAASGSYVKVELDSGEIGFVPAVMLESASATPPVVEPRAGEYQVYPPIPGAGQQLPPLDPAGQPPAGAIPTVIDPDAPASGAVPPVTPHDSTFPTPPPATTPPPVEEKVPLPEPAGN